ncbi:ARM repeat-containing protein [Wolfiporia cocos MD-104 SS10]|uniref:ARM repeat-containing protein n=1 Tax=Wolfiporia cocos (strain MD-104) TaxID=742152 RepID=A0A2H3JVC0_WOLCO|nr:ARM repeat-containing protein [Wolfiporia cocos MD-104 SS10]
MDYLRNLGSAAVSSLVQKSGLTLPFSLGPRVTSFDSHSIWVLYDGQKRDDGTPVSIFEFDSGQPGKRNYLPLAKNALRKLRTIRHPDVLKFMDAVETDSTIYIMTERVRPLASAISEWSSKGAQQREDWLIWGLHRVSVALAFVNDSCASTHGNLRVDSIFISASGEWKLGGFEVLSSPKDDAAVLYTMGSLLPESTTYAPPEVKKGGWSATKELTPAAADSYALGLLIHCAFNPSLPLPATAQPPHPPPTAASRGAIPNVLFSSYKRLLNPNPKSRLTAKVFLELGTATTAGDGSGFFADNSLVKVCTGLDNFSISNEGEKATFLRTLKESASSFPSEFVSYRVLPSLVSALQFGGASAPAILPLVMQMGKTVAPENYSSVILVHLVKLFTSPDRGTRLALLEHLPEYAEKLDKKAVVDKIWPHLQTGFSDTVAVIREATVKSIILLSDKFNDRILNNDLLRFLAKMQGDPEASIRTNTCILIGRLGPSLGYNTKRKVLVPAFSRALKDPFVHCRVAGLMALMATIDCFDIEDLAGKVIPNMAFTTLDKEKLVRDQAFKAMELFVKKLEEHAATMPETVEADSESALPGFLPPASPGPNTLVNTAAGAAGALAGWAMSSLSKKLAAADLQSTMSPAAGVDRPSSAPLSDALTSGGLNNSIPGGFPPQVQNTLSSPAVPARPIVSTPTIKSSKGMQLGASKVPTSLSSSSSAPDWAQEAAAEVDVQQQNPWGNDDLIDVNADQDDWSAFESAPAPLVGLGLGDVPSQNGSSHSTATDEWGMEIQTLPIHQPKGRVPSMARSPTSNNRLSTVSSFARSPTPSESGRASPATQDKAAPSHPSTAGMTKEEKAAEMARRKEERRQRIAALKEQKKNAGPAKV